MSNVKEGKRHDDIDIVISHLPAALTNHIRSESFMLMLEQ